MEFWGETVILTAMEMVEQVHTIGYDLKDAPFTVGRDFGFNVAGIKIEGMSGEVNNIPRWLGRILADNTLGVLGSPDMIAELKQALAKEKMIGEYQISTLDPHFYIKLRESMKELERDDFDRIESMMLELFRMRRGKLVKLADSIKLNSDLYGRLTVEENVFYKTIYENSSSFEKQVMSGGHE